MNKKTKKILLIIDNLITIKSLTHPTSVVMLAISLLSLCYSLKVVAAVSASIAIALGITTLYCNVRINRLCLELPSGD